MTDPARPHTTEPAEGDAPGDDDPGAIALLRKLSTVSRRRWPETAVAAPRRRGLDTS